MQHITMRRVVRLVAVAFAIVGIFLAYAYATGVTARLNTLEEYRDNLVGGQHQDMERLARIEHTTYASHVDVEALWADHDALVACIANTSYTRDLILQCLDDYTTP